MTVPFPALPRGAVVSPHLVRVGGDLVSALGGPTQRITRLGSRYAASVELPSLDPVCAGAWLACSLQAEALGQTLSLIVPQMIEAARTTTGVRGGGTAGSNALNLQGSVEPPVGSFLSFAFGGRNYLHFVVSSPTGSHITVAPLLRVTLPNNSPIEVAKPILEGFVDDTAWSLEWFRFVGHKFTITESA